MLEDTIIYDDSRQNAIEVSHASFTWDPPPPESEAARGKRNMKRTGRTPKLTKGEIASKKVEDEQKSQEEAKNVFQIHDVNLSIPRGKLVAIVGAVGSGKSSLLQGLIGEMRKTEGEIVFGGSVAYCPQAAWIQVCYFI